MANNVWTAETYGERWTWIYDRLGWPQPEAAVDFLERHAGSGPALELAVGTGRVALPLAARGVEVHGIDASPDMLAELRKKPGGDKLRTSVAKLENFELEDRYSLIFLVLHGLFYLQSQEHQVECFQRAAAHLTPGGVFIIEAFVPDLNRLRSGRSGLEVLEVSLDHAWMEVGVHDAVHQHVREQHIAFFEGGMKLCPSFLRYAWPAEIDLMARIAGLAQAGRYGDWDSSPFTAHSKNHVSVYRKLS